MMQHTRSRSRIALGATTIIAGAIVAATTFMPWIDPGDSTGWDLHDMFSQPLAAMLDIHGNSTLILNMWSPHTPFFTGPATLAAGIVLAVLGIVVIALPGAGKPGALEIGRGVAVACIAVAAVAALVSITDLASCLVSLTSLDGAALPSHPQPALYAMAAAGVVALVAVTIAVTRRSPGGGEPVAA